MVYSRVSYEARPKSETPVTGATNYTLSDKALHNNLGTIIFWCYGDGALQQMRWQTPGVIKEDKVRSDTTVSKRCVSRC